jgi:tRNA pseudouridine38-40 synthase
VAVRLDLEYDGTDFAGWARQPAKRTVQGELEAALTRLLPEPVEVAVAGRTDRGVHATGQVCSYEGPLAPLSGLNALLPPDVAVTRVSAAPDGWNARYAALSRSYRFRVLTRRPRSPFERRRALHHPYPIDRAALDACAAALPGTHDLTAFTPAQSDHRLFQRTIIAAAWVDESPDVIAFTIEARTFMRYMNRVLVGTMLEVAGGRRTVENFVGLLEGALRSDAGETVGPEGLHLTEVRYPE